MASLTRVQMIRQSQPVIVIILVCFLTIHCQGKRSPEVTTKSVSAIQWSPDLDIGFQKAKQQNKPLMIEFTAAWCPYCKMLEDSTFGRPEVVKKAAHFIPVRIDVDRQPAIANQYEANARKYGGSGIPNVLFLNPQGKKIMHVTGYEDYQTFLARMDSVLMMRQAH